jgi:hypothetical protein
MLKKQQKQQKQQQKQQSTIVSVQEIKYYLIVDFEATCFDESGFDYENEIIEFPCYLTNLDFEIIDVF